MATKSERSLREKRRERELALRRQDLMDAAIGVFAERGFDAAPMGEIAAQAEVSLATLYDLFDGKDGLYRATLAAASTSMMKSVTEAIDAIEDPGESLLAVPAAMFRCFDENRDIVRIYVREAHAMPWKLRDAIGAEAEPMVREFEDWVTGLAEQAAEIGRLKIVTARVFAYTLIGTATTAALRVMENTPERSLETLEPEIRAIVSRLLEPAD